MAGILHLVGTPIGNLGDVTQRAKETLARVDLVAAEDTRRARKLLSHLRVRAELTTLFERGPQLLPIAAIGVDQILDAIGLVAGGHRGNDPRCSA